MLSASGTQPRERGDDLMTRRIDLTEAAGLKPPADLSDRIAEVLRANGITETGDDLHGWRCGYPDRYGPCDCFEGLLAGLEAVLGGDDDE